MYKYSYKFFDCFQIREIFINFICYKLQDLKEFSRANFWLYTAQTLFSTIHMLPLPVLQGKFNLLVYLSSGPILSCVMTLGTSARYARSSPEMYSFNKTVSSTLTIYANYSVEPKLN